MECACGHTLQRAMACWLPEMPCCSTAICSFSCAACCARRVISERNAAADASPASSASCAQAHDAICFETHYI